MNIPLIHICSVVHIPPSPRYSSRYLGCLFRNHADAKLPTIPYLDKSVRAKAPSGRGVSARNPSSLFTVHVAASLSGSGVACTHTSSVGVSSSVLQATSSSSLKLSGTSGGHFAGSARSFKAQMLVVSVLGMQLPAQGSPLTSEAFW